MAFTLVNAGTSPFGRKVAIALFEKGLPVEVPLDTPWADESCTPQHNPLEQLPLLIAEGERFSTSPIFWSESKRGIRHRRSFPPRWKRDMPRASVNCSVSG